MDNCSHYVPDRDPFPFQEHDLPLHSVAGNLSPGGKVKNRTLANLSHCTPGEIEAIRLALAHKSDLTVLSSLSEAVEVREGLSIGVAWLVYQVARWLGIECALGTRRE